MSYIPARPKHRANKLVKTEPRIQVPGRHARPYIGDRTRGRHEALVESVR
jgi:hypothetical protein